MFCRPNLRTWLAPLSIACLPVFALGCDGETDELPRLTDSEIQPVVDAYAVNVSSNYVDALAGVTTLKGAVATLVAQPSQQNLDAARAAWTAARPAYLQTEAFRFYGGPIDDETSGPEGRINGWPLDEFYIDYVEGQPDAGIINDSVGFPSITAQVILDANEAQGEKALSAGFHAVEFLLWGQDQDPLGPGARPFTDYVSDGTGTAQNQQRRGLYLTEAVALLETDLMSVAAAWDGSAGAYAQSFVAATPKDSLAKMMTGIASLAGAELSTERMNNAYEERDQEEEHSCFSDTTHQDHLNDLIGIENVYFGRYGSVDAAGIDDLVEKLDPDLNARVTAQLQAAHDAIVAIPQPFDQAIQDDAVGGGREKIETAIDSLYALAGGLVEVGELLDVELLLE